jgi:hypothetical protein
MKTTKWILAALFCLALFAGRANSQPAGEPKFLTVTTIHWSMNVPDFKMDNWKALEKEYFDKVTSKNEYIESSMVLLHYFTADNTELKIVNSYSSWENIEKAEDRSNELAKAAWPDETQRRAFFKKESAYYTDMHSDEIYSTLPFVKPLAAKSSEPLIYYVMVSKLAFPDGGTQKEAGDLMTEYMNKVISKNPDILAYYPARHAWGSDGRDFVQAFVVKSFGDVVKALDGDTELAKTAWPDEAARKEYFDKLGKYFTGMHADYIYTSVPELSK